MKLKFIQHVSGKFDFAGNPRDLYIVFMFIKITALNIHVTLDHVTVRLSSERLKLNYGTLMWISEVELKKNRLHYTYRFEATSLYR